MAEQVQQSIQHTQAVHTPVIPVRDRTGRVSFIAFERAHIDNRTHITEPVDVSQGARARHKGGSGAGKGLGLKGRASAFQHQGDTQSLSALAVPRERILTTGVPPEKKVLVPAVRIHDGEQKKARAAFYFDPEDEHEVRAHALRSQQKNISSSPAAIPTPEQLLRAAQWLAQQLGYDDTDTQKRLTNIIISFWKGIRSTLEIKEVLQRSFERGGLGVDVARAEQLVRALHKQKNDALYASALQHTAQEPPPVAKAQPSHTAQPSDYDSVLHRATQPPPDIKKTVSSSMSSVVSNHARETGSSLLSEIKTRKRSIPHTESIIVKNSITPAPTPRAIGPVEELGLMTRADFRHLAKTAEESAQKIFQKIDLLGDESLEVKAAGIRAWKTSPLYQEYLAVGQKSIEEHTSVEQILLSPSNKDISLEEFEAITDLSRQLAF